MNFEAPCWTEIANRGDEYEPTFFSLLFNFLFTPLTMQKCEDQALKIIEKDLKLKPRKLDFNAPQLV